MAAPWSCAERPGSVRPPCEYVDVSGYLQPSGERRSYLLVDGAQLVPGSFTDVAALGADYLAFSFHKMLAPFGVGVLYARPDLLAASLPRRAGWPGQSARLLAGPPASLPAPRGAGRFCSASGALPEKFRHAAGRFGGASSRE